MTQESLEIARTVDQFPEWARIRMRDALLQIAEVYSVTVMKSPMVRVREEQAVQSNVVVLRDYRPPKAG